jgi:universal stress protein E
LHDVRHILAGLDLGVRDQALTPGSRLAADQALWLAQRLGARVTLLHSMAEDECFEPEERKYVLVPAGLSDQARGVLERTAHQFRRAGVEVELALEEEDAWLAIVRRVLRGGIDLVIAGKRGEPEPPGRQLGAVSAKLVRKCPGPVWVCKPGSPPLPRRVLAATDLEPVGQQAVSAAAWLATHCDAELHVVHAIQLPLAVQLGGEEKEEAFERDSAAEAIRRIQQEIDAAGYPGTASFHVGVTSPARAILQATERVDPDLVVMGTVSRGGVAGVLVGNTAQRLLDRVDCSLLAVKPEDFVCPVEPSG